MQINGLKENKTQASNKQLMKEENKHVMIEEGFVVSKDEVL